MSGDRAVEVKAGAAIYRGWQDGRGSRFLGIRYAEAPVGGRRFLPPAPLRQEGLLEAQSYGAAPAQILRPRHDWAPYGDGFATSEDCLNLNIYTPAPDDARRPVIIHAFGGGFQTGAAQGTVIEEAAFAQAGNVVLVRPNMRTGALGFLHLGDDFGPEARAANRGMLDFVAALEWVHRNIAAFGGDPDNITLVGLSSGAFTISALFGVDGIADLYRRVWLMSGPASRIIQPETAALVTADFLSRAGVAKGDLPALQALPLQTILTLQEQVLATHLGERNAPGGRTLGIVLDGESLQRHPLDGLASSRFADHGMVVGWTRDEARIWYATGAMPEVPDRATLLASIARFAGTEAETRLAALETEIPNQSWTRYEEIFLTRTVYRDPALKTLATHQGHGGRGSAYEFDWSPQTEGQGFGAAHGFDEPFVFNSLARFPLAQNDENAAALAKSMSTALIDFAHGRDA